jgi:hypothetical protein
MDNNENYNISPTAEEQAKLQNTSVAALVIGIIGIIFPPVAIITGIIALVFVKKAKALNGGLNNGLSTAGLICAIVSILFGVVFTAFLLLVLAYVVIVMAIPFLAFFLGAF